jgi:hypothetical protein
LTRLRPGGDAGGGHFVADESVSKTRVVVVDLGGGVDQMMYPLVHDLAAEEIPMAVTRRVLAFSKQAFYKAAAASVTDHD